MDRPDMDSQNTSSQNTSRQNWGKIRDAVVVNKDWRERDWKGDDRQPTNSQPTYLEQNTSTDSEPYQSYEPDSYSLTQGDTEEEDQQSSGFDALVNDATLYTDMYQYDSSSTEKTKQNNLLVEPLQK